MEQPEEGTVDERFHSNSRAYYSCLPILAVSVLIYFFYYIFKEIPQKSFYLKYHNTYLIPDGCTGTTVHVVVLRLA